MHEMFVLAALVLSEVIWVLIPLVPAILIYQKFPDSRVAVTGPLAGLTLNATGAFAGYLVVLAALYPISRQVTDTVGSFQRPYWTIEGQLQLVGVDGKPVTPPNAAEDYTIEIRPATYNIADKYISLKIPQSDDMPFITILVKGFGGKTINLSDPAVKIRRDDYGKKLVLDSPITISATPVATFGAPLPQHP